MTQTIRHTVEFKINSSFNERESLINNEILKRMDLLRQKGFYPIGHEVANKNDKTATIIISYNT